MAGEVLCLAVVTPILVMCGPRYDSRSGAVLGTIPVICGLSYDSRHMRS